MHHPSLPNPRLLPGVVGLVALALTGQADPTVKAGWDLWTTIQPTTFAGQTFVGVPLELHDFGGTIGVKDVGPTDTIVRRLNDAHSPSEAIPTELVALQLQSAAPIDLGLGLGIYYLTLQSERGGPVSTGRMTINFDVEENPHGTFDSFFDIFFDVRLGSLAGPIAISDSLTLASAGTCWSHEAPPGALLIPGVNHLLNGQTILQDFWPCPVTEQHPSGALHSVTTTLPEATAMTPLLILGLGGVTANLRRFRAQRRERMAGS